MLFDEVLIAATGCLRGLLEPRARGALSSAGGCVWQPRGALVRVLCPPRACASLQLPRAAITSNAHATVCGRVSHRRTPPDPLPLVRGGGERRRVSTAVSEQGMEVVVQAEEVGRLAHSAQVRDRPRHKRFGPCTPPQLHYTITWRPYVQNPFSSHTGRPKDSFAMVCTLLTSPTTLHHPSLTTRSGGDHRRCARWTGT